MWLPTQAQVNAATRNAASAAGGAILMFGLSTKISPDTVSQIIAATGTLVNDAVVLIGLVGPILAAYFASQSASPTAQIQAVHLIANSGGPDTKDAQIAVLNAAAAMPSTTKIVNPLMAPEAATSPKVMTQ